MEDWEKELDDFLQTHKAEVEKAAQSKETKRARKFIRAIVEPTFTKLKAVLDKRGREAFVVSGDLSRRLEVWFKGIREIEYTLTINGDRIDCKYKAIGENDGGLKDIVGKDPPTIENTTQAHIGKHFVDTYTRDIRHNPR